MVEESQQNLENIHTDICDPDFHHHIAGIDVGFLQRLRLDLGKQLAQAVRNRVDQKPYFVLGGVERAKHTDRFAES